MAIDQTRELALKILYEVNEKASYSNITIHKFFEEKKLKSLDKAFITDLVYGTIKWKMTIDWMISRSSRIKLNKISPWVINILRIGVYQILYLDKVPVFAACNESVELTKRYGHKASSSFVNAVLRNIARNKENLKLELNNSKDDLTSLSIKYSYPNWMIENWIDQFGVKFTKELLACNNEPPEFSIRVNTLKTTPCELKNKLIGLDYEVNDGKYVDEALTIKNPIGIFETELYKLGYFQVQDESSMLVTKILNPKQNEKILDVCSAPGGKSTHIAAVMNNRGYVLSRDIYENKIKLIDGSAKRLGINIIKTECYDATEIDESLSEKFDRVLVDAPCLGLGIIRRKPEIKWVRCPTDIEEIKRKQIKILNVSSKYVCIGGILVYSTCSINSRENEDVVLEFLKNNTDFKPVELDNNLFDNRLLSNSTSNSQIQIFPNVHGIDGFYIAKMQKVRNNILS